MLGEESRRLDFSIFGELQQNLLAEADIPASEADGRGYYRKAGGQTQVNHSRQDAVFLSIPGR